VDTCVHGNEASGSKNGGYFLHQLSIFQVLDQLSKSKFLYQLSICQFLDQLITCPSLD
jgi:hypothetical protein